MLIQGASLAERARAELLADSTRPDAEIASLIGGSRGTVARARQLLAAAGLISGRAGRTPVPATPQLPARPELDGALCATVADPGLWTSPRQADRAAAIRVCERCPVLDACRAWSMSLPTTDSAIYAGMNASERIAARRELARQQLAEAG
jgi:DNA-binding transcriptional MocR family regulator